MTPWVIDAGFEPMAAHHFVNKGQGERIAVNNKTCIFTRALELSEGRGLPCNQYCRQYAQALTSKQ
jgi:hypothetical protein